MKNGIIYKLCCRDVEIKDIYVGSTINFRRRKYAHKSACNNPLDKHYNFPVYQFIRERGGWLNWDMVQVDTFDFTERRELKARERHYMEELGATLNKTTPNRSKKEWYEDNKERMAVWRVENKEHIAAKNKEWRSKNEEYNKNRLKDYRAKNKEQLAAKDKEYRAKNREKCAARQKEYNKKNKERIAAKKKEWQTKNKERVTNMRAEKIICCCGYPISRGHMSAHQKTKSHWENFILHA